MSRLLPLALAAALLPVAAQAQLFNKFGPGSYVLAAEPGVRHTGQLRLRNEHQLEVQAADGQTLALRPADVHSLRLAATSYRSAGPFTVEVPGPDIDLPDGAFVELADSGQVLLLRYGYTLGNSFSGGFDNYYYLLQRPTDAAPTVLPTKYYGGAGPAFYAALRPFLAGRPDLEALVDNKRITILHIPRLIHALNAGQPYVPRRLN